MSASSDSRPRLVGIAIAVIVILLVLAVAASRGAEPAPAPTATPAPPAVAPGAPTTTPVPPTSTSVPLTATPVPPTATAAPPTPTAIPPAAATSEATTVTDVVWQWVSLVDRGSPGAVKTTAISDPTKYTIIFRTDGTVSGQADCNTFGGTYTKTQGYSIKITTSTRAFCGENSLDQQYLQLLGQVAAGGPDGAGGFVLQTAGGAQRLTFKNGGPAPK